MELELGGHVAVITGPAKGMGAAVTRAFAAEGCHLALLGRDTAAIEPVAEDVRHDGTEVLVYACDVTDAAACVEALDATVKAFGRIDIQFNVAGGSGPIGKSGANTTSDEFHDIVDLNMRGCFNTIKAVAPVMIASRQDRSSTSAAPSECADAPAGLPTPPANGDCAASPGRSLWNSGRTT